MRLIILGMGGYGRTIADVAEQVGITNLKNLSRQFKALKQVSPNEYRKEHKMKNRL